MSITGIEQITYGVLDLPLCKRYFEDWGLRVVSETGDEAVLTCLNQSRVRLVSSGAANAMPAGIDADPTIREVMWGVSTQQDLERIRTSLSRITKIKTEGNELTAIDPNGLTVRFRQSAKVTVPASTTEYNTWGNIRRVDKPSPVYERAIPIEIDHVVFRTPRIAEVERWYTEGLGFQVTDRYPGRGVFMRCMPDASHHDIFLIHTEEQTPGLDHVAFCVNDIHEIFGGGIHFSRKGWKTELGPGRHPISSAYFWYFKCPAGGKTEYAADEDYFSPAWKAREFQPSPKNFAEWASTGDIDILNRKAAAVATAEAKANEAKAAQSAAE